MKNIVILSCLFVFCTVVFAQQKAGDAARDEVGKLNRRVLDLYNQKKIDEALQVALKMQAVIEQNGLSEDPNAMSALANLGELYIVKGKEESAIPIFEKLLENARKVLGENSVAELKYTERAALACYRKPDLNKAEEYYLRVVAMSEKAYGPESKKVAEAYEDLGNTYRLRDKQRDAETAYLKVIELNDKILKDEEKKNRTDIENYLCFNYHVGIKNGTFLKAQKKNDDFDKIRADEYRRTHPSKPSSILSVGVVNGNAKRLVKPPYPAVGGASGFAIVYVDIDEKGKVITAKSHCGIAQFLSVSEKAALNSDFTPTLLNGQPVKVSGIIVYNFGGF